MENSYVGYAALSSSLRYNDRALAPKPAWLYPSNSVTPAMAYLFFFTVMISTF